MSDEPETGATPKETLHPVDEAGEGDDGQHDMPEPEENVNLFEEHVDWKDALDCIAEVEKKNR